MIKFKRIILHSAAKVITYVDIPNTITLDEA